MKGKLERGKSAIFKALLKYGHSNFKLNILVYCEKEETLKLEQKFINTLKPEHNILKLAGSSVPFSGRKVYIQKKV